MDGGKAYGNSVGDMTSELGETYVHGVEDVRSEEKEECHCDVL